MGNFLVMFTSRVEIYDRRGSIRLATVLLTECVHCSHPRVIKTQKHPPKSTLAIVGR